MEASWIGYRAQAVQPVFVEVIDPIQAELIKVQREIFNRVLENLKLGVTVDELAELTKKTAQSAASKTGPAAGARGDLNLHGRGQGDDGPIITPHAAGIEERDEHGEREGRRPGQLGTYFREPSGFRLQITNEDSAEFARYASD